MAKMLTLAQTCRERDVRGPDPLRVCHARAHRCTSAAIFLVLPVFLLVVPVLVLVLPLFTYADVRRLILGVMTSVGSHYIRCQAGVCRCV
jgi:hypothetical protein